MKKSKIAQKKVIEDGDSDSESPLPQLAVKATKKQVVVEKKKAIKKIEVENSDDDTPLVAPKSKITKTQTGILKKPIQPASDESEEEKPIKHKSPLQKVLPTKKHVPPPSDSSQEEEPKVVSKASKVAVQAKASLKPALVNKKKPISSESSQEEEEEPKVVQKKPIFGKKPVVTPQQDSDDEDLSDEPPQKTKVAVVKAKQPLVKVKSPVVKAKSPQLKPKAIVSRPASSEESEEESEEKPKPQKKATVVLPQKKAKVVVQSEGSEEEVEVPKKKATKKVVKMVAQSQEEEQVQVAVKKAKSPVLKAKSPVLKAKVEEEANSNEDLQVCVQSLAFTAYEDDVRELFNQCGEISNVKLLLRPDGKSKGLAFVTFTKKSGFLKALQLNGSQHMGRTIKVEKSIKKEANTTWNNKGNSNAYESKGQNKYQNQGQPTIETNTLFIGGLSYNSTVQSIKEFFQTSLPVNNVRIITDKETGNPRGFGYIEFESIESAKAAYNEFNGQSLDGRFIRLDSAAQRPQNNRQEGGGYNQRGGSSQRGNGYAPRGGRGGSFEPRNTGNAVVGLTEQDKMAKKGAIAQFQGKVKMLG